MSAAPTQHAMNIIHGDDRGTTDLGWLYSRHSFSFGRYRDPARMDYHTLRVLNDDIIKPGGGFGEHGHDNMEIITWVLNGAVEHKDSTGGREVLRPGEVQMMSAGSGLTHSEMNASKTEPVHLLQIWIMPAERNIKPAYLQRAFDAEKRRGNWQTLVSPDEHDGSLPIRQDATLRVTDLDQGASIALESATGRHNYLHVATGSVEVNGAALETGDAITFDGGTSLDINAAAASQLLWFDLP